MVSISSSNNHESSAISARCNQLFRCKDVSSFEPKETKSCEPADEPPYHGKCQYKTGKCFNERTLKRDGTPHSLCEEHRKRQNSNQRRSDRKYQKIHAMRRRERLQRLRWQASIAQQLEQLSVAQSQHSPPRVPTINTFGRATAGAIAPIGFTPSFMLRGQSDASGSPLVYSFSTVAVIASTNTAVDEVLLSSTGIDDWTPHPFLDTLTPPSSLGLWPPPCRTTDSFDAMPNAAYSCNKETWSDTDIEFLQTLLL